MFATTRSARFLLHLERAPAGLSQTGLREPVEVPALGEVVQPLVLQQPRRDYHGPFKLTVQIGDPAGSFQLKREIEFLGPDVRLLREEEEETPSSHEPKP